MCVTYFECKQSAKESIERMARCQTVFFRYQRAGKRQLALDYNNDSGLPLTGLEQQNILVVQVKSYEGEHWETNAVDEIRTGMETYDGDAGILITTALASSTVIEAIDRLSEEIGKPVSILSGRDVAKFVLKYLPEKFLASDN